MNELVGLWLIGQNDLKGRFAISEKDVTRYDYRIMFAKKWASLIPAFNRELAQMKNSGEFAKILERYGIKWEES